MSSTVGPRRAEHLGSLLRPRELIELTFHPDDAAKRAVQDREITAIVNDQLKLGYRVITDGEYRRFLFFGSFFNGLEGFTEVPFDEARLRPYMPHVKAHIETGMKPPALICTGKIRHTGRSNHLDEFRYLKSLVGADRVGDIKITIPTPNWYHIQYREGHAYPADVYASDVEYFADLATVYRTELQLLYDEGLRRVQIDDPNLSYFCSLDMLEGWRADPANTKSPEDMLDAYVHWYSDCFSQVPPDMFLGMHICRGNFNDERYTATGGYDRIARKLFRESVINTFYLEYDTPRAGGFEPLRELPLHKNVVLGVVTTKSPALEDRPVLRERVRQAAACIAEGNGVTEAEALQRLAVSPQCGFASYSTEDRLTHEDMLAKLRLVQDLARDLWPDEV